MNNLRIAFAGDRDIAVWVLDFILSQGCQPLALLVPDLKHASHAEQLITRCSFLDPDNILTGRSFREPRGVELLRELELDYVIGIHFPLIIPGSVLTTPRHGVLNLHPAYLPYNRGWHTPTWAIMDGTPIGATLHFMDAGVDTGDIVHQKKLTVSPGDTANTLYARLKQLEFEVFKEAWPLIVTGDFIRQPQSSIDGTAHKRCDLFAQAIQQIDLEQEMKVGDLLQRLRALSTNQTSEAAYFEAEGVRYRVQVNIVAEPPAIE